MTPGVPILLYHRILPGAGGGADPGRAVHVDQFARDLTRLRDAGWRCLSAATAAEMSLAGRRARRTFALTFDDGCEDFANLAHPLLMDLGFTATVFVVTDRIGERADWGDVYGTPLLDAATIRDLAGDGIRFGSHGHTHACLPDCDDPELENELKVSRGILEDVTGSAITEIAWPYGANDDRTRRAARVAGYDVGFGVAGAGSLYTRLRAVLRPSRRLRMAVPRREVRGGDSEWRRRLRMGRADGLFVAARKVGLPPGGGT